MRLGLLLEKLRHELYSKVLPAMSNLDGDEPEWDHLAQRMDVLDDRIAAVEPLIRVRRTHPKGR
jgi:hypothetical protein